jgi:hypothetical protein
MDKQLEVDLAGLGEDVRARLRDHLEFTRPDVGVAAMLAALGPRPLRLAEACCPKCKAGADHLELSEMELEYAFRGDEHASFLRTRPAECRCGWKGKGSDCLTFTREPKGAHENNRR